MTDIILPQLGVTLDEETHTYALPDGTTPPSVTEIMGFMSDRLYKGIPDYRLAIAAERGRRVHKQTYYLDTCGYTDRDDDTTAYIDAYERFLDNQEFRPIWIAREWIGYHKSLLYCGTLDGIGYFTPPDGTGVDLWDLKSTTQFHEVMLKTQVCGGYKAILESWGIPVRRCYGTCLLPGRDPPYIHQELKGKEGNLWFLNCLSLYNAMAQEIKP